MPGDETMCIRVAVAESLPAVYLADANFSQLMTYLTRAGSFTELLGPVLGRAVQVDSIQTRVECAYHFNA
jgi:hypothetical protein